MAKQMIFRQLIWVALALFAAFSPPAHAMPGPGMSASVTIWSDDPEERFLGSGFVVRDGGAVVTNAHVVGSAASVMVETPTGSRHRARVAARDEVRDLALLRTGAALRPGLAISANTPAPGAPVFAIGSPLGTGLAVTTGIVSALDRQIDPQQPVLYLQHSAPVNPGSSGGPLLNARGQVIGINTRIADGSRYFVGIAYAVPARDILAFLADPHRASVPNPGIQVRRITRQIAEALDLSDRRGVLVEHVGAGGPAAQAGVKAGDILLKLGISDVRTPGDVAVILAAGPLPDTATVLRAGQVHILPLDLSHRATALNMMSGAVISARDSYTLVQMGLAIGADGRIAETSDGTAGFYSGLSVGDRIIAVNGIPMDEMPEGWQESTRYSKAVLLLLRLSDGSTRHVLLDPWATAPRLRPASGANVMDQDVVSFE